MATENVYVSSDLGLATALETIGFKLVEVDRRNSRRAAFIFQDDGRVQEVVEGYWNGTLAVPAQAYFETIKRMKSRLYA